VKLHYDLHIHSALSPCGDQDMTPNNIVRMAMLKGLDLIAVTDHNSAGNLPAVKQVAEECGVMLLPGLEVTTAEEVHLLAYFQTVEAALELGGIIYASLPPIKNRPDIFGRQLLLDSEDQVIGEVEKLLVNACGYSLQQVCGIVRGLDGVPVPAHVNRESNSIVSNLGFIPEDLGFSAIELAEHLPAGGIDLTRYRVLHSSDAHYIADIAERVHYLDCVRLEAVLDRLREKA